MSDTNPELRFSRHARNRLRLWKIAEGTIESVVRQPDRVEPSQRGRTNAWKWLDNRWIRVTYIQERQRIIVITVTARRRGPEG